MRVIGSQDMSTRCSGLVGTPAWVGAGIVAAMLSVAPELRLSGGQFVSSRELRTIVPPLRFAVDGGACEGSQRAHSSTIDGDSRRGQLSAGRLIHEGHELVGKAGHGAADADAADVG